MIDESAITDDDIIYTREGSPTHFTSEDDASVALALAKPFYYYGHRILFDGHVCRYIDTGENIHTAAPRACPSCRLLCDGGPDPCFGGLLPGVAYACCGHGRQSGGYIKFEDGRYIAFGPVREVALEEALK